MDSSHVIDLLDQLDDEIDDLEESLAPVLKTALSETASKLPLLDKAKLYVLVTYAIESILFSYLRLNGVKAREHPVFTELTRVKQYFDKIKIAETPRPKRENMNLDKQAAARIIKAGLSGNDKYDLERAEQQAKEKARAHIKFEELPKAPRTEVNAEDAQSSEDLGSDTTAKATSRSKKRRIELAQDTTPTSETSQAESGVSNPVRKRKKRSNEKRKGKGLKTT
ncbi:hypothetical protein BP5796_10331 [Coleophoma crateriformis]|uniref:Exosome complex protein n=1 Tax=Coleophoma crateriformis TaxID=565419 RepID=A0A3D8QPU4_9HELO|nr:hypothetical protein BP5796_10331 [Coleophoma crateriformis]